MHRKAEANVISEADAAVRAELAARRSSKVLDERTNENLVDADTSHTNYGDT